MTHILLCISSQRAKFWTVWWIQGEENIHAQFPRVNFVAAPCPKPCVFSWLHFLYEVKLFLSPAGQAAAPELFAHPQQFGCLGNVKGMGKAGGGGFALATAVIRGGIRKYHLGEDPPCSFPPEATASCCFFPTGRKMWFSVTVFSRWCATFTYIAVVHSLDKRVTSAAGWGLCVVMDL